MAQPLSRVDNKAYQEWLELCEQIRTATAITEKETTKEQERRKKHLRTNGRDFIKYYFPHYATAEPGWFHIKALKVVTEDPKAYAVLEWAREHAKSVYANIFIPMILYSRGELTGMIVVSNNQDKAQNLLGDIQAEFISNQRWIADYGEMRRHGDWSEGSFSTNDGVGFWALGRGQSPRGLRKFAKRPNYASIDDIDDKIIVRNQKRVREAVEWIREDLMGALSILGPSRIIVAGNRIHKHSILAHIVGDLEPGDPKHKGIKHIKVYATEDPRTHKKLTIDQGGKPAWPRYSLKDLQSRFEKMGTRAAMREYYHEHSEEGTVFKTEWLHWDKMLPDSQYMGICVYCDPSFKDDGDYKAIVVLAKGPKYYDVLYAWVRKTSIHNMVMEMYQIHTALESYAQYWIEANFIQDNLLEEFHLEGQSRNYLLPIRGDKRVKPPKDMRIENVSPFFERGLVRFNEEHRKSPDMQELISQFLGFPYGNDDGPDAFEGAFFKLQGAYRTGDRPKARTGRYQFGSDKYK